MTRTILALAAALVSATTLFATSAQACISCNYTPEVVNTPVRGKSYAQKRVYVATPAQPARRAKSVTKPVMVAKPVEVAKPKTIETAANTTTEEPTASEPKRLSAATLLETGGTHAVETEPQKVAAAEVQATEPVCSKFFPTIGKTMTVPCE